MVSGTVYPIEFMFSRQEDLYPRQVFVEVFQDDRLLGQRTVDNVCSPKCLLKRFGRTYKPLRCVLSKMDSMNEERVEERIKSIKIKQVANYLYAYLKRRGKIRAVRHSASSCFLDSSDNVPLWISKTRESNLGNNQPRSVTKAGQGASEDREKVVASLPDSDKAKTRTPSKMRDKAHPKKSQDDHFDLFQELFQLDLSRRKGLNADYEEFSTIAQYRVKVGAALNSQRPQLSRVESIKFVWKKAWGEVSNFTNRNHEIDAQINVCESLNGFQPFLVPISCNFVASAFCTQGESVIFPVDNRCVDMCQYRYSVKFIVTSKKDSGQLRSLLMENDYLVFAHAFDVKNQNCKGGFLYLCRITNMVIGLLLSDMFSILTKSCGFNNLITMCNRYAKTPDLRALKLVDWKDELSPDVKKHIYEDNEKSPVKDALFFFLRMVLFRVHLKAMTDAPSKSSLKLPLLTFPRVYFFNIRNKKNEPFTVVVCLWDFRSVERQLQYLADCLREDPNHITFTVKDVNSLPSPLTEKPNPVFDEDNTVVLRLEFSSDTELNEVQFYSEDSWVLFEDVFPVCRFSIRVDLREVELKTSFRYLMPLSTNIKSVLDKLGKFGCKKEFFYTFQHIDVGSKKIQNYLYDHNVSPQTVVRRCAIDLRVIICVISEEVSIPHDETYFEDSDANAVEEFVFNRDSFLDDTVFLSEKHQLCWRGRMEVFLEKQRDVKYDVPDVWISCNIEGNEESATALVRRHSIYWGAQLKCVVVSDPEFLIATEKFETMAAASLHATLSPLWDGQAEERNSWHRMKCLLMFLKKRDGTHPLPIVPYFLTDRQKWVFMVMVWSQESRRIILKVFLDEDKCASAFEQLKFKSGILANMKQCLDKQALFSMSKEESYVRAVVKTDLFDRPIFGVLRQKSANQLDFFNFLIADESSDAQGTHVMLCAEQKLLTKWMKDDFSACSAMAMDVFVIPESGKKFAPYDKWPFFLLRGDTARLVDVIADSNIDEMASRLMLLRMRFSSVTSEAYIPKFKDRQLISCAISRSLFAEEMLNVHKKRRAKIKSGKCVDENAKKATSDSCAKEHLASTWQHEVPESNSKGEAGKKMREAGSDPNPSDVKKSYSLIDVFKLDEANLNNCKSTLEELAKEVNESRISPDVCQKCKMEGYDMGQCSLCGEASYCSEKCLKDDWAFHQKECFQIQDNRVKHLIACVKPLRFL